MVLRALRAISASLAAESRGNLSRVGRPGPVGAGRFSPNSAQFRAASASRPAGFQTSRTCSMTGPLAQQASIEVGAAMTAGMSPAGKSLTLVLAAGEGTRMRSSRPKVLHTIGGRSLIGCVLAAAARPGESTAVVVGPHHEAVA